MHHSAAIMHACNACVRAFFCCSYIVDPFQLNLFAQFPIVCPIKCDVDMINLHKYAEREREKKEFMKTGVMSI